MTTITAVGLCFAIVVGFALFVARVVGRWAA